MKKIIRIAKLELNTLFYSPIPWFLMVVLLFTCGQAYVAGLEQYLNNQNMGGKGLDYISFLTKTIFNNQFDGVFPDIGRKLYLYIPLLTMGLISREISTGTIKLLYSSPIRVREIVLGKFSAMVVYSLVLIAIIGIFVVAALFNIKSPDVGLLLSGLLGFFLLLITYAAIGLFMSCLTSYQVAAAISTLVFLSVLGNIGYVWQDVDFVRDLTYFLSIYGRSQHMLDGLISTSDVLYFLLITAMFLIFSILKLRSERETKPGLVKAGRYLLTFMIVLVLGYISSRPALTGYFDATATHERTLTPNTQKVLKEMGDAPLEVTSYINLIGYYYNYGNPGERNNDVARWAPYLRFKPNINFNYVYYWDQPEYDILPLYPGKTLKGIAEMQAKVSNVNINRFKTPGEIRHMIDLKPENNRYVMQLKYKGKSTFLRLYNDANVFPSETETTAALKRLMTTLPKIVFAEGELERSVDKIGDKHYKVLTNTITFRESLVNQGFDVSVVSLSRQDIPANIAALVIADPKVAFDTVTLKKIHRYIASGGNLLIAGEPGRQSILNPLLEQLGVSLMNGMLVQKSKDFSPDLVQANLTATGSGLSKRLVEQAKNGFCITMPGAAALSYSTNSGFTVKPLLLTDVTSSWNKLKPVNMDMVESTGSPTAGKIATGSPGVPASGGSVPKSTIITQLNFSAADGDLKGTFPTALSLTRNMNGKEQRIIVTGDADFLSNTELIRNNLKQTNFLFATSLFGWFSYGNFPIDTSRPKGKDTRLYLTDSSLGILKIVFKGVLPGLMLIFGSVLLLRRRRR